MDSILCSLNLEKVCRVCLKESENTHSIFDKLNEASKGVNIYEILSCLCDVNITDERSLPNVVCENCFKLLENVSKLQTLCRQSEEAIELYYWDNKHINNNKAKQCKRIDEPKYKVPKEENYGSEEDKVKDSDLIKSDNDDEDKVDNNEKDEDALIPVSGATLTSINKSYKYYLGISKSSLIEYHCNLCMYTTDYAPDFLSHLKSHGDKPFMCNKCKNKFGTYKNLQNHLKRHKEVDMHPYKCESCKRSFLLPCLLNRHIKEKHTKEISFLCSICGRGFCTKGTFDSHMTVHINVMNYLCTYCGKKFARCSSLDMHIKSHTGERPFKCTKCQKAFVTSTKLTMHLLTHTDLKPYSCKLCEKSYNKSGNLSAHMKTHSADKLYACDICGKTFGYAHTLRGHRATHENLKIL